MDWIEISPDVFEDFEDKQQSDGVEIVVGLSPFDIPEGVRGHFDDARERFVIELKYMDTSERRLPQKLNQSVTVFVGENSHRLYEIELDVDKLGAESVQLSLVQKAIDSAVTNVPNKANRLYGIAKRVLTSTKDKLDEQLISTD